MKKNIIFNGILEKEKKENEMKIEKTKIKVTLHGMHACIESHKLSLKCSCPTKGWFLLHANEARRVTNPPVLPRLLLVCAIIASRPPLAQDCYDNRKIDEISCPNRR